MKEFHRRRLPHIEAGERPVFVTFCTDKRLVIPESVRSIVLAACVHSHRTRFHMHGAIVMPDHVHLVLTPILKESEDPYSISEIMQGIKSSSAHTLNKALKRSGKLWQEESFDRVIRNVEVVREKVEYVCLNPVRAGLVLNEDQYPWLWREWIDDVE